MTVDKLTHLHLTIPSSGSITEPVKDECNPSAILPNRPVKPARVSFAEDVKTIEVLLTLSSSEVPSSPDIREDVGPGDQEQDLFVNHCTSKICVVSV